MCHVSLIKNEDELNKGGRRWNVDNANLLDLPEKNQVIYDVFCQPRRYAWTA